jgi:hypothetical protein
LTETTKRQRIAGATNHGPKTEHFLFPTELLKLVQAWHRVTGVPGQRENPLFFYTRAIGPRGDVRRHLTQNQLMSTFKAFCGQSKIARALKLWKVMPRKFKKDNVSNKK